MDETLTMEQMFSTQRSLLSLLTIFTILLVKHIWNNAPDLSINLEPGTPSGPVQSPDPTPKTVTVPQARPHPIIDKVLYPSDAAYPTRILEAINKPPPANVDNPTKKVAKIDCRDLPNGADVVIVLRTSATTIYQDLPLHQLTTFRCALHFLVFSDVSQRVAEQNVLDVLNIVNKETRNSHPDFEVYRKLQEIAQQGGRMQDLAEEARKLEKWKMLPMIRRTLQLHRTKKWFMFLDADTFVSWPNLLRWIERLNSEDYVYAGMPVFDGERVWADGGSGFLLSRPAARKVADAYPGHLSEWETRTNEISSGDRLLGEVLAEVGVPLLYSSPHVQDRSLASMEWTAMQWCRPAVTLHDVSTEDQDRMWQFEQVWIRQMGAHEPILFADWYANIVDDWMPEMKESWNNSALEWRLDGDGMLSQHAAEENKDVKDAEACRALCEMKQDCLQWLWQPGKCTGSSRIRLGSPADGELRKSGTQESKGLVSGWMIERINRTRTAMELCNSEKQWITNNTDWYEMMAAGTGYPSHG
ncbi:hypothetical protein M8818_003381 [Zalaria obscura]|uniref:Uncharacterized protein n=1 Tax=Zalaria obscura TaxID=2024903 RepID=A0ACC3SFC4_9PEZI